MSAKKAQRQNIRLKKEWYLVALAHPNGSLDGVGVALMVKVRESNDDEACRPARG